ncbi:MAG: NAD(P)/FAD-dependent oxidoreductase [Nakamurella sp.]
MAVPKADVLVVGGGHNGLVAAILAAQAGKSVILLERSAEPGGATVGQQLFPPHPARLSRYSYLIALMPDELVRRLGISLPLASRTFSSFTPVRRNGIAGGLLVERVPGPATEESFRQLTGGTDEYRSWTSFYAEMQTMAGVLAPMLTGPLIRRADARAAVIAAAGEQIWIDIVEAPLSAMIIRRFRDDTVRGVVATDGLIGTHTSLFDPELLANRCFLYHLIGRGTGEWLVPVGGMGALTDSLVARARAVGVDIRCATDIVTIDETPSGVTVSAAGNTELTFEADHLLAAVAPAVVDGWLGREPTIPTGAQIKINMLLDRLPRMASGIDPKIAFAGTMHLEEGFWDLEAAFATTAAGNVPAVLPGEVYCHSLTDPSILNGHPGATLTLFGLHAPVELFRSDPAGTRTRAAEAALIALQRHLAEPLLDCLARDADGQPCLDISSPVDLEHQLNMPGGNIFHDDLSWPWLADEFPADTPAERYGVDIPGSNRILLAGAGSRRGGGVSGLGGAAAVDALLEMT